MSVYKEKPGCVTLNLSTLKFDEVPTEGSPNLVESGAVAAAIGNLGQPLQWKGPATVAELNAGITGIQPGWTYTLTDAGTLTDGSVTVDVGDEVAWTEDDEWFKVGGESSKTAVFTYTASSKPLLSDLQDARDSGKAVFLVCGEDVSVGSYQLETGSVLSLVFDTGRPGYGTHSMEFMCTGAFKGSDCVTVRCMVNGDNTWEWNACDTGAVKNGGVLTDATSVNVPNNALSTLATAQATLTLNVNVGSGEVPNFAVEVTPSVDVTLTVTKTVGNTTTTLNPSAAGGDSLTTGKMYQVTCVGSCWTLAEFTVPTP